MNRRSFLSRLVIGAAAVLGAGAVKVGTAEGSEALPKLMPGQRWMFDCDGVATGNADVTLHIPPGTYTATEVNEWMQKTGATRIVGASAIRSVPAWDDPNHRIIIGSRVTLSPGAGIVADGQHIHIEGVTTMPWETVKSGTSITHRESGYRLVSRETKQGTAGEYTVSRYKAIG